MPVREKTIRVIKKNRVAAGPSLRIGLGSMPQTPEAGHPRARVIRDAQGRTVIEVVCACGRAFNLECAIEPAEGSRK
ncbi:MAG: hypothetical protein HZA50_11460 [Planctomycetes bacterium]|nr:hypothetical protein [Planctomycetota bacterium]